MAPHRQNALANAGSLDDEPDVSFSSDSGDGSKAEARSARFNTKLDGNRFDQVSILPRLCSRTIRSSPDCPPFDQMRVMRERERLVAISRGEIQDPLAPQAHSSSSTFKGTCTDMCPAYEREEREAKFNVDKWELVSRICLCFSFLLTSS